MTYTNNVSTNIIRDNSKEIDYVVTPNTKEIFDRIFVNNFRANKSFCLIGNYGTGKSTFLWALEKNLKKEKLFFNSLSSKSGDSSEYDFIKIVGENNSLLKTLSSELKLKGPINGQKLITALEKKRLKAQKNNKGLVLIADEFGKFLEYASKEKSNDELYLIQQISEWANNDINDVFFIITLHQNFANYGKNLSNQDKLEWEKIKGRFVDLTFNEPVEQLIYFASKKLQEFNIPNNLKNDFKKLTSIIQSSKLVSHNKIINDDLSSALFPLDWLSSNVLVNSLQRYGQNERSLFSFLNDDTDLSIRKNSQSFFGVSNVYDYLINSLATEINSGDNPHRAQWMTTFRALERAELVFDDNFSIVSDVIKTICLVNIFSKSGGLFNDEFIINYFKITKDFDVSSILNKLTDSGIIRFYKHSNKINFLEGTDLDLEQELIRVNKEINQNFSIANEIQNLVELPVLLVKRYSYETGTRRFFEYKVFEDFNLISVADGVIDGYINLVFDEVKLSDFTKKSKDHPSNIFVLYKNSRQIKNELLMILKYDKLIIDHQQDINAVKLLNDERQFHLHTLENLVMNKLFNSDKNIWINNGKKHIISSKHGLYECLTSICYNLYNKTPKFNNELINKQFLSTPISTARKHLIRAMLSNEHLEDLGFEKDKFPPQKAIYISLLKESGIHQKNKKLGYYELGQPKNDSNFKALWDESVDFIKSSLSNKRNLIELYELLSSPPYKLKKGLIDFWIPVFLISKNEDFALFHIDGGFVPFITEDTIDLIHKKPQNFLIKSYDVTGLKLNLLESYKELVQIGDSDINGTKSTFLSIFANFLKFQRNLKKYSLKTNKLSSQAIKLRDAISLAKDPEDALFNLFPAALGYHSLSIKEDIEVLASFTNHIQTAIREIRSSYDELLNRIEQQIIESFYCSADDFNQYKAEIISKVKGVNSSFLSKTQNIFHKRLISPLDDRASWIKSVADVALGTKSIDELLDEEEPLLMSNIKDLALSLIKAGQIHHFNTNTENEKLISFGFFKENGEFVDDTAIVKHKESNEFIELKNDIIKNISNLDQQKRKELLADLLAKELNI